MGSFGGFEGLLGVSSGFIQALFGVSARNGGVESHRLPVPWPSRLLFFRLFLGGGGVALFRVVGLLVSVGVC